MVIDDVCEVISRQTIALYEHLIIQIGVGGSDVAKNSIVESSAALGGYFLTNYIGLTGGNACLGLRKADVAAGIFAALEITAVLLGLCFFAETIISVASFDEKLGIGKISIFTLGLDIRSDGAADIGAFIPNKPCVFKRTVNNLGRTFYKAGLIGIFDTKNEFTACLAGNKPGVDSCTDAANMHKAGGAGCETGANLTLGNAGLHGLKIKILVVHILCVPFKRIILCRLNFILYFTFTPKDCQGELGRSVALVVIIGAV